MPAPSVRDCAATTVKLEYTQLETPVKMEPAMMTSRSLIQLQHNAMAQTCVMEKAFRQLPATFSVRILVIFPSRARPIEIKKPNNMARAVRLAVRPSVGKIVPFMVAMP